MNPLARIMLGCPTEANVDIISTFNKSKELEKICRPRDIRVVADCRLQSDMESNEEEQEEGKKIWKLCKMFGYRIKRYTMYAHVWT